MTIALLESRLATLNPTTLRIEDESQRHRGHVGAPSGSKHLRLLIVSTSFSGLSKIARHRMVYDAAGRDLVGGTIHALSITALTPDEYSAQDP